MFFRKSFFVLIILFILSMPNNLLAENQGQKQVIKKIPMTKKIVAIVTPKFWSWADEDAMAEEAFSKELKKILAKRVGVPESTSLRKINQILYER